MVKTQNKILVTGPDGFVGSALCAELVRRGHAVRGALWHPAPLPEGYESTIVGDIGADTDWSKALVGIDVIVHLAARVHIMRDTSANPLLEFRKINVDGTSRLARAAVAAGVRRFIFMSTIKVNGERTEDGISFTEADPAAPEDSYGISKWEAECALTDTATGSNMETVIIRAPLIYGNGVKGNFAALIKLSATQLMLPFGAINNRRSLLYLGNLIDFISMCIESKDAANELFLLSDGNDLSTTELISGIRKAMGKSSGLIPVPSGLFILAGKITGKNALVNRLFVSLSVDSSKARRLLKWTPPFSVEQGLKETVQRPNLQE